MVNSYILLRKNKEFGPFDFEELKASGLKPDDLIWVEGQSVCWLRPEEISELKCLVGIPATQPAQAYSGSFDPDEPGTGSNLSADEKKSVKDPLPGKSTADPGKKSKSIYSSFSLTERPEKTTMIKQALEEDLEGSDILFSKSQGGIHEQKPKNVSNRDKRKSGFFGFSPGILKLSIYLGLPVLGLAAGIFIGKGSRKIPAISPASRENHPAAPANTASVPAPENQAAFTGPPAGNQDPKTGNNSEVLPQEQKPDPQDKEETIPEKTVPAERKNKVAVPVVVSSGNESPNTESRVRETREADGTGEIKAEDIASQVSVKTNEYSVGSFGGIKNLQLTVTNNSRYTLGTVAVELRYLKPMDELLRTENIIFNSVPPNGTQTVAVKKSSRGIKVTCRIIRVEPKEEGKIATD